MKTQQSPWTCACALGLLLCLAACGNEERPRAEPSPEPPAPPASAAPVAPVAATPVVAPQPDLEPTAEELPVSEDFDTEAEQQITAKNFRAELTKLEKEVPEAPAPAPAPTTPAR